MEGVEIPVPGVRGLDHTADLGLEIRAPDVPELFRRAALGALWLILERPAGGGSTQSTGIGQGDHLRDVELIAEELPILLRSWLQTVLYWEEAEGFVVLAGSLTILPCPLCDEADGQGFVLRGKVSGVLDQGPRVREVKGVTLHGLKVEKLGPEWLGSVIFDV